MRSLTSGVLAALEARALVARDFIWIIARDRSSPPAEVTDGYWSGLGNITADVIDPETGSTASRSFDGAGGLISVSDIPMVSNVSVQNVTVSMSQVADAVNDLIRTYDCKQAKIQIFRGLFDPETRDLVDAAQPRFVGFIDRIEVNTPAEGGDGSVVMTCASHTQEMTRSNSDTRSDAQQKLRDATDDFLSDAATIGEWELAWGRAAGKLTSKKAHKKGSAD